MEAATGLSATLGSLGASLALAFIVVLLISLIGLTVVYVGSAVIVLERFARVARSWGWMTFFGLLASLLVAAIGMRSLRPDLVARPWSEWGAGFTPVALQVALVALVVMLLCAFAVRRVDGTRLGTAAIVLLTFGASLMATGTAPMLWLLAPLPVLAGAAGWLAARRARDAGPSASEPRGPLERVLLGSALAWGAGLLGALAPYEQQAAMTLGGATLVAIFFVVVILGLLPMAAAGLMEMRRSVEWFIAIRYLVAKRRQVFISAISAICVGGIAAGVWLIIVVLSVMNGFERTWRDEILGNRAHFTVHSGFGPFSDYEGILDQVRAVEGVTGASPYIDAEGMVRGDEGRIFSVRVRGVDPATVADVTDLRDDLIVGSLDALTQPVPVETDSEGETQDAFPGIVLGNQLAVSLGAVVGEPVVLISPFGGPKTPLGPAPRLKRFRVVGIFQSSFFQYDEVYTYSSIPATQDFRGAPDVVDGIEARTTDFYRSRGVGAAVREALGYPFYTRDWKDFFPAFFQALKSERVMMFLLLTMIMVVAAFLIVATLIMMIMEKSSDIAILKAMGAQDATIERVFAIEGTLIGLAGTLLGVIAGVAVTAQLGWLQSTIESVTGIDTLPASVYQFSTLPTEVDPVQIGLVAAIAMVLSLGATLLPSRQGARLDPAEGLRYE